MKQFFKVFTAFCCVIYLSACGKTEQIKITEPDGSLDPCELRFSWWGGDDRHEATLEAIELWSKLHPEIKIVSEYGGWDGWTEKVSSQVKGGTAPDIMQINYDWLISMTSDGGEFYDLGKLGSIIDTSGYDSEILEFGMVDGVLNAIPVSLSGRGLFYNSEVYSRLGLEYPETWGELISLGDKFGDDTYPLDLDIQNGGTAWYLSVVYVQQKTGRDFISIDGHLGFTEEDLKMALDFYKELEDNNVIRDVKARIDEDGNAALYQSSEFIDGSIAGVLEWGSSVGKYEMVLPDGVLECGPLLKDDEGNAGGWMVKPALLYSISGNTEHPDEAAAFIDFMLNNVECAEILGTSRGIPISRYAEESLEKKGKLTGLAQELDEMLERVDTVIISPYMELARMKEYYNTAIEAVSYNTADTQTAAHELYVSLTEYLDRVRK